MPCAVRTRPEPSGSGADDHAVAPARHEDLRRRHDVDDRIDRADLVERHLVRLDAVHLRFRLGQQAEDRHRMRLDGRIEPGNCELLPDSRPGTVRVRRQAPWSRIRLRIVMVVVVVTVVVVVMVTMLVPGSGEARRVALPVRPRRRTAGPSRQNRGDAPIGMRTPDRASGTRPPPGRAARIPGRHRASRRRTCCPTSRRAGPGEFPSSLRFSGEPAALTTPRHGGGSRRMSSMPERIVAYRALRSGSHCPLWCRGQSG